MVAMAADLAPDETKRIISKTPTLKSAYKAAIGKIAILIREHNGNKSKIAEACGVPRHVVEQWIRENQALTVEARSAEESIVDLAEAAVIHALKNNNPYVALDVLATKGSSRGWARKQQVDLRAFAQATDVDLRLVIGEVAAAISRGQIDATTVQMDD